MPQISQIQLESFRREPFRLAQDLHLTNKDEALDYVNKLGFVYLWPIKGITYPSLWTAVAGNREVASKHDDPGHITWGWKDEMLDKKLWYYAKVLRGKATIISQDIVPYFYALSENYGDPEEDFKQLYEDGLLTRESKLVYEALLREGPLDTVNLRRTIRMTGKASNSPSARALTQLQRDFKILPIAVAQAGAWRYSFVYELVHRYYPDLPQKARLISRKDAQTKLLSLYFAAIGMATAADVRKLFQWPRPDTDRALQRAVSAGELFAECTLEKQKGEYYALPELLN